MSRVSWLDEDGAVGQHDMYVLPMIHYAAIWRHTDVYYMCTAHDYDSYDYDPCRIGTMTMTIHKEGV